MGRGVSATPSTEPVRPPLDWAGWWGVARRPRWIAALVLALGIAAGFAALGQWQIGRAVQTATPVGAIDTETARPLAEVDEPQTGVTGLEAGVIVTVAGTFVHADWIVLDGRFRVGAADGGGQDRGAWLVGHLVTDDGASLAVAAGWLADADAAERMAAQLREDATTAETELTGRYLPGEAPQLSDFEAGQRSALAPAELVNLWPDAQPIYNGYLVSATAADGLETIDAPPPLPESTLNLLNLFYAVEWAIFAGFALYIWYRLVRDVQEREADAAAAPAAADSVASVD